MRSRTRFSQSGMAHPGKTVERMEKGSRKTETDDEENHREAESVSPSPSHAALRSAHVYCFM